MYFGIAFDHVFFTPLLYSRSGQKNGDIGKWGVSGPVVGPVYDKPTSRPLIENCANLCDGSTTGFSVAML
jgi:hypothetical protein